VTAALVPHLRSLQVENVWEPAAGDGKIVAALRDHGFAAVGTDIIEGNDFLNGCRTPALFDAIVSNPPYGPAGTTAQQFIEHALAFTEPKRGAVAMLLKADYDSGITRRHLFADCRAFALKLVLMKRITWFEPRIASPSENHSWFAWSWRHSGRPTIAYAP